MNCAISFTIRILGTRPCLDYNMCAPVGRRGGCRQGGGEPVGSRKCRGSLHTLPNFAVDLKLLRKMKPILERMRAEKMRFVMFPLTAESLS